MIDAPQLDRVDVEPEPRRWRHRVITGVVIVAGLLTAAFVGGWFRTPAAPTDAVPVPAAQTIEQTVAALQATARQDDSRPKPWQQLTEAYVQQAIQTNDPTYYQRASESLAKAIQLAPDDPGTWRADATLAVSLHHFGQAATSATQVLAVDPFDTQMSAVLVDAYTELGRYPQAAAQLQHLLDHKPGAGALTRVSYQRELRGDIDGALAAMDQAATATASGTPFEQALIDAYRGDLLWSAGRIDDAGHSYQHALDLVPGHGTATIGLARVEAAQGRRPQAIDRLHQLVAKVPLPAAAVLLGEIQQADGRLQDADASFALVDVIARLQSANGVDVDLDITLFEADHSTVTADTVNRARRAHANRPSIYSADALAWTLHRAGADTEAVPFVEDALHLGTVDAQLHLHAALIFDALGDTTRARTEMTKAASANTWASLALREEAGALAARLGVEWR